VPLDPRVRKMPTAATLPSTPPDADDELLAELLEDDLLGFMLAPPLVPSFCRDTVRP
jgi:hypothetical protein